MPTVEKFLRAVRALQESAAKAEAFPNFKLFALFGVLEIVKMGFVAEEIAKKKKGKVPKEMQDWAERAGKWGVSMQQKYNRRGKPNEPADETDVSDLREWIRRGRVVIRPPGHKALEKLTSAEKNTH